LFGYVVAFAFDLHQRYLERIKRVTLEFRIGHDDDGAILDFLRDGVERDPRVVQGFVQFVAPVAEFAPQHVLGVFGLVVDRHTGDFTLVVLAGTAQNSLVPRLFARS
jgi:hypothetical protein